MRGARGTNLLLVGLMIAIALVLQGCPSLIANVVASGQSVQNAIDQADPGDTIKVMGTHDEDVTIKKNNLTLKGENGATIDGDVIVTADDVTIENFSVTGKLDTKPGSFANLSLRNVTIGFWNDAVVTGIFTCDRIVQPGADVASAISQISSGANLCLATGTYQGDLDLAKSVVLRGFTATSGNPVLDGNIHVSLGTNGKLQGLSIKGSLRLPIPSWTTKGVDVEGLYRVSPESGIADRIRNVMGDQVTSFAILRLDGDRIFNGLKQGRVTLPFVNTDWIVQRIGLNSDRVQLRAPELDEGVLRSGSTTDPEVQRVPLPREQNFRLTCRIEVGQRLCGAVTALDDGHTMFNAAVLNHPDVGTAYIEPVGLIVDDTSGLPSGLHIVYNQNATPPIVFPDEEQPPVPTTSTGQSVSGQHVIAEKETQLVIDGDQNFYQRDPSTVWRRMGWNVLITAAALIGGDETDSDNPNHSGGGFHEWSLDLEIKGKEVWVSGGPTTTNASQLNQTLGDPNYFLIHSVNDDEMHLFYAGYDVGGTTVGRAGGIPHGNSSAFGNGSQQNNAWVEDTPQLSNNFVSDSTHHELGHLMGATHGNATRGSCSGSSCMTSIMNSNGNLDPFFSDANDKRIEDALNSILP